MIRQAVYENDSVRNVTGETIRPGGFFLTERGISFCDFSGPIRALDIGSGIGATVDHLINKMGIEARGIDPSEKLVGLGRTRYNIPLTIGRGEVLPYEEDSFDLVLTECTLSLMDDHNKTIEEAFRVLRPGGYHIITDVCAKETDHLEDLKNTEVVSCLRNLFDLDLLSMETQRAGFKNLVLEDWSSLLKKLMVEIIFKYGSMKEFWNITTCGNCKDFEEKLKLCKPGYFLMVNKKEA